MLLDIPLTEFVLVGSSLAFMIGYQLWLLYKAKHQPRGTAFARHKLLRRGWVERAIKENGEILIIQNVRNWIMAANFLASTSILFVLGLLSTVFSLDKISAKAHMLNFLGSHSDELLVFKILLLTMAFLGAFFNFSLCLRSMTHASFMTGLGGEHVTGPRGTIGELERGAFHYMIGIRSYYLAIPLALWFFGPSWMALGTFCLLCILWRVDR